MNTPLVWYVSYGSNLSRDRFLCYLTGDATHRGARDGSPPESDQPVRVAYPLYFASPGIRWGGGGTAFLGHTAAGDPTLGRAYLLSLDQFEDVLAQENGAQTSPVDLSRLETEGRLRVHDGRYGAVLWCGRRDDLAAVTFTAPRPLDESVICAPTLSYLEAMATGLGETFGLGPRESARYLCQKPGVSGRYSVEDLARHFA